ncbi:hypothetical protein ACIQVK_21790 [Streptomyces sp. NPDC090493]|uniref:hypothetical protein n=1 Tax=Streptomyces sp. NPDC090493 TaxID=3365964 RepID=UPI00382B822D
MKDRPISHAAPIDRVAVVGRHRVRLDAPDATAPLSVGNGEFACTVDITGLQTFPRFHDMETAQREGRSAVPLGTQAQWGFHTMPNPKKYALADTMETYASVHGPIDYPVLYDFTKQRGELGEDEQAGYWLWANPQRLDLGRIGLELRTAPSADPEDDIHALSDTRQDLDLWSGMITSRFRYAGENVHVRTVCHPAYDGIAVRIESELLRDGRLTLSLAFPYASDTFLGTADWSLPDRHRTEVREDPRRPGVTLFERTLDEDRYVAALRVVGPGAVTEVGPHTFRITGSGGPVIELLLGFAPAEVPSLPAAFAEAARAAREHWETFWRSGAAVDLSGSSDERAPELERRIVLSQYQTAVHCAGSTPPAESGLVHNTWAGKFHLEMHWWHAAHFTTWGRPELLERSLDWYLSIMDVARDTARGQGFPGARWPKHVGPEGRESPNRVGPLLIWQQPNPIHLVELLRRAKDDQEETLARYAVLVEETAEFMAAFLARGTDGRRHLMPPIVPAQEVYDADSVVDPTFELAYFAWGIETAQQWRSRSGLNRRDDWDLVLAELATPAVEAGRYAAVADPPRTAPVDHPSMLAGLGMVPATPVIDPETMRRTLHWTLAHWDWPECWGWDFPMAAMCATRLGEPDKAIEALLHPGARNTYLPAGHNCQRPNRIPVYLPGNGGLLSAVALMAGGWDGCEEEAPGFPKDGRWTVRQEGFVPSP